MTTYRVTGQNRETGARMTLEFAADSKAAAERKAHQQGMDVRRVEDLAEGNEQAEIAARAGAGRGRHGLPGLVKLLLLLAALAAAACLLWARVQGMVGR